MPILELKSFDKFPKKKPFKFLSGVFRRGGSEELVVTEDMLYGTEQWRDRDTSPERSSTPAGHLDIENEMENLHLSRRDNPYLSSCEALDDVGAEDASLSPTLGSPRQSSLSPPDSSDAMSPPSYNNILELHSHLIRSPPPVHWPVKMDQDQADSRALSPESGVCSDNDTGPPQLLSQSVERMVSPLSGDLLSPIRGQTPAVSPARGQTPTPDSILASVTPQQPPPPPASLTHEYRSYSRSISQSSTRLRSKTPDEEFSPTRFNIYAMHQRSGLSRSCKSKSSYLVTSPGRDCVYNYQPASRRSLAQLASNKNVTRKASMDTFTSWLPSRRKRGYGDKPSFTSHKSMSCMGEVGEDAGLISHEAGHGHGAASPAHHRKSLHNIKKSFSLKQKKSFTGPLYVDIDSQGKH